jgi:DNA (cytosine-5)-methyltransferase 1
MSEAESITSIKPYTCIEGFSGPGGLSLGLKTAGFDVLAAFDIDEFAVATHRANLGERVFQADACTLAGSELLETLGLRVGQLDLFAGGPPCQGFSKQKRGAHEGDDRNELVLEFARLAEETQPRAFLLENVAMLGGKRGKDFLSRLSEKLQNYRLYPRFYNSADFGLAQTRERFILVGRRKDVRARFRAPAPLTRKWLTVGDVLAGLPEPPLDYTDHPEYPNHQRARVTQPNIDRFSFVPQGGGWQDIPWEHRLDCHKVVNVKQGGWPDVYGRLRWDGQCPTITGGFDSFTRGRYGHPLHDRPLTPREAARLQGFPDDFAFKGTRGDVRRQIGNAVPPPLAYAVGRAIAEMLSMADNGDADDVVDDADAEQLVLV